MPGHHDDGHENPDLLEVHTRPPHDGSFLLTVTGALDHHIADHHIADRLTEALQRSCVPRPPPSCSTCPECPSSTPPA